MHLPGLFQIIVIALILLLLFGRGRMSDFMGDFGSGVKRFRKALSEDDEAARLHSPRAEAVQTADAQPSSDATGK